MDLGFAEKVGIFFGLVLIILIGSIGSSSFVNAAGGEQYVFKTKWGALGTANGQFKDAGGIGVDALGHIYVVDRSVLKSSIVMVRSLRHGVHLAQATVC